MVNYKSYIISSVIIVLTAVSSSYFTTTNTESEWFKCIKSDLTPPGYVFSIIWTIIYILLIIVLANALSDGKYVLICLIVLSCILQVTWCYLYFGTKHVREATYVILVLFILSLLIIYEQKSLLLLPYSIWLAFATLLNYQSIAKIDKCNY